MSSVSPTDQQEVEGIRQGSTKEHTMSSHLHTEPIRIRQLEIAAGCAHAPHQHELRDAAEQPRQLRSTGRQRAAAVAIGLAAAFAGVACGAVTDIAQKGVPAHMTGSPSILRAPDVDLSPRALALRIRELEARGYVQGSCTVNGILMINPRTHGRTTVAE
jgi:hypothetical protein